MVGRTKPFLAGIAVWAALLWMSPCIAAWADLKEDVGFTRLQAELGVGTPTGGGVQATQVEAASDGQWMPDAAHVQFTGKAITDKTGGSTGVSGHATSVGVQFYGNSSSLAPGIAAIDAYSASAWLGGKFLMTGVTLDNGHAIQPMYHINPYTLGERVLTSPSRVANHSWVGSCSANGEALRRLDFVIEADEFIHVAAVNNGTSRRALLSGAFNALTVGRTDGSHPSGTLAVDDLYMAGRACPLIVVPLGTTSSTTPVAAAAVALLVQAGRDTDLGNDPEQTHAADRAGGLIVNAERSETIKAALLAGARRITDNTSTSAQITDYRADPAHRSANGLDTRFGAGQLDIYNGYHIVAAGEQNSAEDAPAGNGAIGRFGFDVDPCFGGLAGSNRSGTYRFTAGPQERRLYASLVWHLHIDGGTWDDFVDTAALYNLDLRLYDTSAGGGDRLVAVSEEAGGNSENLWTALVPGRSYRLEVAAAGETAFLWDYALAWRMATPPDTDGDGMEDEWEVQFGLDYTLAGDGDLDSDGDGLGALAEYQLGTDPDSFDTDGDGTGDGDEVTDGTDPLDAADYPRSVPAASPAPLAMTILALALALPAIGRRRPENRR